MEERQDEQCLIIGSELDVAAEGGGHGVEIGVIEHDALGLAGRAARVHEQSQRVGGDGRVVDGSVGDAGEVRRRECFDLDRGGAGRHEQSRSRVVELVAELAFGERGVHGRDCRPHAPGPQHGGEERDRVRQHDGHHAAAPDPARGELLRARRGPPFEAAVAEFFGHVAHGGPCGPGRGAVPWQVVEAGIRAPCRGSCVEFVERHRRSPPRADCHVERDPERLPARLRAPLTLGRSAGQHSGAGGELHTGECARCTDAAVSGPARAALRKNSGNSAARHPRAPAEPTTLRSRTRHTHPPDDRASSDRSQVESATDANARQ